MRCLATLRNSGIAWIALAPLPTTATFLLAKSTEESHNAVWTIFPVNPPNCGGILGIRKGPRPANLYPSGFSKFILLKKVHYLHIIKVFSNYFLGVIAISTFRVNFPQLLFLNPVNTDHFSFKLCLLINVVFLSHFSQIFIYFILRTIMMRPIWIQFKTKGIQGTWNITSTSRIGVVMPCSSYISGYFIYLCFDA